MNFECAVNVSFFISIIDTLKKNHYTIQNYNIISTNNIMLPLF